MRKIYFISLFFIFQMAHAQPIAFTDPFFKNALLGNPSGETCATDQTGAHMIVDTNGNSEIEVNEAAAVYGIVLGQGSSVTDLNGIEYFTGLVSLSCSLTNVTALNLPALPLLQKLHVGQNRLSLLNVTRCTNLKSIICSENQLTALDLSGLILTNLQCDRNLLTTLEVRMERGIPGQDTFNCSNNQLQNLTLSGGFHQIVCADNQLTALDLSHCLFSDMIVSNNPQLTFINIKNGIHDFNEMIFSQTDLTTIPQMQYLCVDDGVEWSEFNVFLIDFDLDWEVNAYCTLLPGGDFYTISGNATADSNGNGCDETDPKIPFQKFQINNEETTTTLTANASGNYFIPVPAGTFTLSPVVQNTGFFTFSPENRTVSFSADGNAVAQDFCISPNSMHNDLKVSMFPTSLARPGFNADYKIVYQNNGTTTRTGFLALEFNNVILDLMNSDQTPSQQSLNNIGWDFIGLQPLETREINISLRLHSPTETPPLNDGDVLNYTVAITPDLDENPDDNSVSIAQVVRNSLDPNDIICLEGETVQPETAGKYVHYMIRFENIGTANAQNVIIQDAIDPLKLFADSIIPVASSHDFHMNTNGNRVDFVFENINLPFDDANNDGYIVFKILTSPELGAGGSFNNSAKIYFDYNFPIETNVATTNISVLETDHFDFADYFVLSPNPAGDVIRIRSKKLTAIASVGIYNILGQLVLADTNFNQSKVIDVSSLKSGNYFIKVNSDKGTSNAKFIKK